MIGSWVSPSAWRLVAFFVAFLVIAGWEFLAPWRAARSRRSRRWPTHLALAALDAAVVRLALPMGAVGLASACAAWHVGLLRVLSVPPWVGFTAALVGLDLAIYAQHVVFHKLPWLWRLHRVHHADEHLDASTGVRFHPAEALLSLAWKGVVIAALGAPLAAVFAFELLLNLSSLFNHGNVALPRWLEPNARWLLVTPAMHRVHHSQARAEQDSNFGFNLAWWDRIFGTYRAEAAAGTQMRFGLAEAAGEATDSLPWALGFPFTASARPSSRSQPPQSSASDASSVTEGASAFLPMRSQP